MKKFAYVNSDSQVIQPELNETRGSYMNRFTAEVVVGWLESGVIKEVPLPVGHGDRDLYNGTYSKPDGSIVNADGTVTPPPS